MGATIGHLLGRNRAPTGFIACLANHGRQCQTEVAIESRADRLNTKCGGCTKPLGHALHVEPARLSQIEGVRSALRPILRPSLVLGRYMPIRRMWRTFVPLTAVLEVSVRGGNCRFQRHMSFPRLPTGHRLRNSI